MSTPNQQRSRYPRPLKATHSFTSSGEPAAGLNNGAVGSGAALSQGSSSCLPSPPNPGPRSDATGFLPSASGGEAANVSVLSTPPASPSTTTGAARRDQFGEGGSQ